MGRVLEQLKLQVRPSSGVAFLPPAKRKTLVLDMDETLIHSKFKPCSGYDFVCNVTNRDRTTFSTVYVYK